MIYQIGDVLMITRNYPNGKRNRLIGILTYLDEKTGQCSLTPVGNGLRKNLREKYSEGFNIHGATNCYSDDYGFSSNNVTEEGNKTVEVVGHNTFTPWHFTGPRPGDRGYDLMC